MGRVGSDVIGRYDAAEECLGARSRLLLAVGGCLLSVPLHLGFRTSATAQPAAPEDARAMCIQVPVALLPHIVAAVSGKGLCATSCKGCGCKGGPGYRHGGRCVSWADLVRKCGPPPHSGCERECRPVQPGCLGRAWVKELATANGLAVHFVEHDPDAETVDEPKR